MTLRIPLLIALFFALINVAQGQDADTNQESVCEKNGKYGVCDGIGQELIPIIYDRIYPCNEIPQTYIVKKNGKYGFLNSHNQVILPIEYEAKEAEYGYPYPFVIDGEFAYMNESTPMILKKNGDWGVIRLKGTILLPFEYEDIQTFNFNSPYYLVQKNQKYAVVDGSNKMLSNFQYQNLLGFWYEFAIFATSPTQNVFLDTLGKEYTSIRQFTQGDSLIIVEKKNKSAVMNADGRWRTPYFEKIRFASQGYFIFLQKGRQGVLNPSGKVAISAQYEGIYEYFGENSIRVQKGNRYGLIDFKGNPITKIEYQEIATFYEGHHTTTAQKNGKYGFINRKGEIATPFEYEAVVNYYSGHKAVKQKGKWGYVDILGKLVIPCQFDSETGFFSEKMIPIQKEGKWGFINDKGETIIPFKYEKAEKFLKRDKAKVVFNGKKGWVDAKGTEYWE